MQLPEFMRSTTLRRTALVAGIFAALIVALLDFVYLKTKGDRTMRSDRLIASQIGFFAHVSPERRPDAIDDLLKQDPGRLRLAGLSVQRAVGSRAIWKFYRLILRPIMWYRAPWSTGWTKVARRNRRSG
jgi:hypothetical protein